MDAEVRIPVIGESISEGLLSEWLKADGDLVREGDELLVLETDKVTINVQAELGGRLRILTPAGQTVTVGQLVASIDTTAATAEVDRGETAPEAVGTRPAVAPPLAPAAGMEQARAKLAGIEHLAPAVQRLVIENHLDPARINGTGRDGRITKADVLRHLDRGPTEPDQPQLDQSLPAVPQPTPTFPARIAAASPAPARPEAGRPAERQTREPLSPLRQRLAERLVEAQRTAAILTTFNEVDMSRVLELRRTFRPQFQEQHGVDLGLMSFFVKASVDALQTHPEVNAFVDGSDLVHNHYYDIGVAVSTEKGLVVPVIRDADRLSMAEIERQIALLAGKARERKLELAELTGGVFTISNGGVFGSLLSTPILNPPQSAILGMHTIQKRAVVVDDEIVIRPMMYLALSYDHRLIDGREAVTFLVRIKECIENPERMLLEV